MFFMRALFWLTQEGNRRTPPWGSVCLAQDMTCDMSTAPPSGSCTVHKISVKTTATSFYLYIIATSHRLLFHGRRLHWPPSQ
jgi:hypothetical protein